MAPKATTTITGTFSTYHRMPFFSTGGTSTGLISITDVPKYRLGYSVFGTPCQTSACCEAEAIAQSLELGGGGYSFTGNYEAEGCYFYYRCHPDYCHMAVFGTGGTWIQNKASSGYLFRLKLEPQTLLLVAVFKSHNKN
jgi:hypothetical protein